MRTPAEVGTIAITVIAVVALIVFCCLGLGALSTFYQPEPYQPVPTGTR